MDSRRDRFVLRWKDPITGKPKQETTEFEARKSLRRLAERAAQSKEEELASHNIEDITWRGFRERYEQEHLPSLARKSQKGWHTAAAHVERILSPQFTSDLTAQAMSHFAKALRHLELSESSISSYLGTIAAALGWGEPLGLAEAPAMPRIKRAKGVRKLMRSRPVTLEEFERMRTAAKKVRPDDYKDWVFLLDGLWKSGLRIEEAMILSWSWEAPFAVLLDGKFPHFKIHAEAEKGHQDRLLPMAPEFADMLAKVPKRQRKGRVFRLRGRSNAGRTISAIGEKAGIKVAAGKFATAHDLRRSFGTRWATKLMPAELKELMRHRSIDTTMAYYVQLNSEDLAAKMREKGGALGGAGQIKNGSELSKNR